eukprot:6015665-Amphidinium_carterae.3
MPENKKLSRRNQEQKYEAIWIGRDTTTGQHSTLTEEHEKLLSRTILRLPSEQQIDRDLLLKVTSLTGEYNNSKKNTDKDMTPIPQQMYKLRSPSMPTLRQRQGTPQQELHFKPPDQPSPEQSQRVPKFPTFPKATRTTVQPPPGLQQPELIAAPPEPILPLQPATESTTETSQPKVQVQQPRTQAQVRRSKDNSQNNTIKERQLTTCWRQ